MARLSSSGGTREAGALSQPAAVFAWDRANCKAHQGRGVALCRSGSRPPDPTDLGARHDPTRSRPSNISAPVTKRSRWGRGPGGDAPLYPSDWSVATFRCWASSTRFDFLGPPRDEGELGWLAHYRVRRLIGEGGIGLVFLAEDTQLSRPVALKVIKPEMAGARWSPESVRTRGSGYRRHQTRPHRHDLPGWP